MDSLTDVYRRSVYVCLSVCMCRKQQYTVEVKGFAAAGRPSTVGGGRRFAGAVLREY